MTVLFISIARMPFLAPTIDNADPFFTLVITTDFYLHHVKMTDLVAVYKQTATNYRPTDIDC